MPNAANRGTRIYYEVEGEGPPLALQHGIGESLEVWRDFGYARELKKDYRLILVDARGHGRSDKPHDSAAYGPDLMVGDVVAVLDDLGIDSAHFYGYSMGAMIGFRTVRYALSRFRSLVLGGTTPYRMRTDAEKRLWLQIRRNLEVAAEEGMEAFAAILEQASGPMLHDARARVLANDPRALLAALTAFEQWPRAEEVLPEITVPCLTYAGEADPIFQSARECATQIPNATFIPLINTGHTQSFQRSDLALQYVKRFLADTASGLT